MNKELCFMLISIALVIVALGMAYSPIAADKTPQECAEANTFSLIPPSFVKTASASEIMSASAFPEDEAGISAYVNTTQEIDLEKLKTIFTAIDATGDNYIIGITPISDLGGDINVTVYADTSGWIVAYIKKDEPVSKVMQWETDVHSSSITSTTLKEAITKAADAADILWTVKDIFYYDFEFPEADGMTIFTRTGEWATNITQVQIPATYQLYEASYYYYSSSDGTLKVDGTTTCSGYGRIINSYTGTITTGELHKIEIFMVALQLF